MFTYHADVRGYKIFAPDYRTGFRERDPGQICGQLCGGGGRGNNAISDPIMYPDFGNRTFAASGDRRVGRKMCYHEEEGGDEEANEYCIGVAGENGGGVAVVRDEEDSGDTTPCRMTKVT